MTNDWHAAWSTALDDLEADVASVETLISTDHRLRELPIANPWAPPAGLGPLPLDLRPRADAILARQATAARELALAIGTNRKHASLVSVIEVGAAGAPRPSYVDRAM
jgi:hypothetical protein